MNPIKFAEELTEQSKLMREMADEIGGREAFLYIVAASLLTAIALATLRAMEIEK